LLPVACRPYQKYEKRSFGRERRKRKTMKCNLKWTNIYSGETGYVGKLMKSKGYFINAANKSDAKIYKSEKEASKDLVALIEMGEAENNRFEAEAC